MAAASAPTTVHRGLGCIGHCAPGPCPLLHSSSTAGAAAPTLDWGLGRAHAIKRSTRSFGPPDPLALSSPNLYRLCTESYVTNRDLNSERRRVRPLSCPGVPRLRSWGVAEQPRLS